MTSRQIVGKMGTLAHYSMFHSIMAGNVVTGEMTEELIFRRSKIA